MQFDVISFRNYLDQLLEEYPGCGDYKIRIVIPGENNYGLFFPTQIDLGHSKSQEHMPPYVALVLDKYEEIKKIMETPSLSE